MKSQTAGLKPIIIFEDQEKIKKELKYLDTLILPLCPDIQRAFEGLGIGEISNNYLNDILFNSCSDIKRLLNPDNVAVKRLIKTVDKLILRCKNTDMEGLLRYLSVSENNNIVFTAQSKEKLKDRYRQYVRTETGINRRKLHEKAVKALNDFKEAMDDIDVIEFFDIDANDAIMPVPVKYE